MRDEPLDRVRLDKWLWAARFYKTRGDATDAVHGGKVEVNGSSAKAAHALKIGDQVRVRLGAFEHVVTVRGLAERRGSASVAQTLYEETAESRAARDRLALQHRLAPTPLRYDEGGRPTKRDRRALERFKKERGGDH